MLSDNAAKAQNQGEYFEKYEKYTQRYEALKTEFDALEQERQERRDKYDVIGAFIATLKTSEKITLDFDDDTFTAVIEKITVYADEHMDLTFRGGVTITEQL